MYSVSDLGHVRADRFDRILTRSILHNGGLGVGLMRDGRQHKRYVAVLVARAFVANPSEHDSWLATTTVSFIDGDLTNVRATNLRWTTKSSAIMHHKRMRRYNEETIQP